VTKGTNEPYRMMTSRSEYRLLLRQDNADERLTPIGFEVGLISKEHYKAFLRKQEAISEEIKRLEKTTVPPSPAVNGLLAQYGQPPLITGAKLSDLIRRPALGYEALAPVDTQRPCLPREVCFGAEVRIKYEGYIKRQQAQAQELTRMEKRLIPQDIDYHSIKGLRIEARQKLAKVAPRSIAQASRISGVNPADIAVLLIYLSQETEGRHDAD
jgi:tRNA uridine 5-carboxymethylaminomethyl modification enzyme